MGPLRNGPRTTLILLTLSFCVAALACSPSARYRVLTFFFDGVPAPEGVEPVRDLRAERAARTSSAFGEGIRQLRERPREAPAAPRLVSFHEPYSANDCRACHDVEQGNLLEVPTDATLCDRCHEEQRHEEGWDHGPINIGTCIPCHVPHASVHEALLSKPMTQLCLDCHIEVTPESAEYHDIPNFADCVACHDPHRMY